MKSQVDVTLDLGLFGEQEVLVKYEFFPAEKGNWMEPSVPATFNVLNVYLGDYRLPDSWWNNPVCIDIIKDVISSTQEDN